MWLWNLGLNHGRRKLLQEWQTSERASKSTCSTFASVKSRGSTCALLPPHPVAPLRIGTPLSNFLQPLLSNLLTPTLMPLWMLVLALADWTLRVEWTRWDAQQRAEAPRTKAISAFDGSHQFGNLQLKRIRSKEQDADQLEPVDLRFSIVKSRKI